MIDLRGGLSSTFNIRPGEGLALSLLFTTAFFKGTSILFFETAANTKFLSDYGVDLLPQVYIATAIVSVALGLVYARSEEEIEPLLLMKGMLAFLMAIMLAFYVLLLVVEAEWLSLALMIWKDVHWVLLEIEFWAVAGFLFNVRQGKRLFGLVGTGDILSNILGGFGMPWIVGLTGTVHLLLIAGVGLSLCFVMLIVTEKALGDRFNVEEEEEEVSRKSLLELCRDRFLGLFFLLSFLSIICYYLLEYIFYDQVEAVFTDEAALAGFFGIFFAVLSVIDLLTSGLVTSRLLSRFGVVAGLVAAPVVISMGVISALAALTILALAGGFFWILIGTKLLHEVATESVETPTFRILYQPLRSGERLRTQAVRESMIEPTAIGLSGVLLLALTEVWQLDSVELSYVLIVFVGATMIVALLVQQEYVKALISAVGQRRLSGGLLSFDDASSLQVLKERLNSDAPIEVITSLKLLEDANHPAFDEILIQSLNRPDGQVRKYVLERIEARHVEAAADRVTELLETERDGALRGFAVRVFCSLRESMALDVASPLLEATDEHVRRGAMIGLLRSGGLDGVLLAGSRLSEQLQSSDPDLRESSAQIIGDVGIATFYRPLLELLNDESTGVRRAALIAAAKLRNAKLAAAVIEHLREPALREVASRALISFGTAALSDLAACFDDVATSDVDRVRLIRIMGRIGGDGATHHLLNYLTLPDGKLRHAALNELATRNYQTDIGARAPIHDHIRQEVEGVVWVLAALEELHLAEGMELLVDALECDARESRERILLLLSFLFPSKAILDAKDKLFSEHPDMRANGLEVVDNLVSRDLKAMTLPLFDDIPAHQKLALLQSGFPKEALGVAFGQREIITNAALLPWTRACAVYLVGKRQDDGLLSPVRHAIGDPAPLVRETAAWVVSIMDPGRLSPVAEDLADDPNPAVRTFIANWRREQGRTAGTGNAGQATDELEGEN